MATLKLLTEFAIHAKSEENEKILVASDFWKETPIDPSRGIRPFGQYGDLGNSFGMPELVMDGISYHVPESEYDRVKVSYLRLGVDISKKLLSYWWKTQHH